MSQQETRIGKVRLVEKLEDETLEEQCKRLLNDIPLNKWCDTYKEMIYDYDNYAICNGNIYEIIKNKDYCGEDIFIANKNKDGTISFTLNYYNGGCGFCEALEKAIKNMRSEEQ